MMDLKPCPFCQTPDAGVALIRQSAVHEYVFCDACSAKGPVGYNGDGEALWNTRPREDALQAEVEVLKLALTALVDEHCDYMLINHLGNPEEQHNIKLARAALKGSPHE